MAEFAYNNAKNTGTGYILFELNCGYYLRVFFKEDIDSHSRSRFTKELVKKLKELIEFYCQNLFHIYKLQKIAHNKRVKSCSYALGKKIWLNSKYIKTKKNKKLKSKFFVLFQVFNIVGKQVYKLKLSIK